jgi:hypothetical protein
MDLYNTVWTREEAKDKVGQGLRERVLEGEREIIFLCYYSLLCLLHLPP